MGDSNSRHLAPKASALPTALIPDLGFEFCARCGQTCGQAVFLTTSTCRGSACIAGVSRDCGHGIFRLEGGATRSQTRRDTNFAIPGYSLFCHDTTASGKNKDFSVCGHSCGQSRFCAVFDNRGKSRKRRRRKAFRRFTLPRPGYSHGTPKASALPTALHPDTVFTLHRKSVFDSPNSILDFGRKVNRPVAYPARIAYNKNITQYIKERAL